LEIGDTADWQSTLRRKTRPFVAGLTPALAALLVLVLGAACNQKPLAKGKDFSRASSVSILLGEKDKDFGDGLQHAYWERDGLTTLAVVDGMPCRHLKVEEFDPGYLYFIIDPTFKKRSVKNVKIEVEYFDEERRRTRLAGDPIRCQRFPKDS
jgi:hypothetical protein